MEELLTKDFFLKIKEIEKLNSEFIGTLGLLIAFAVGALTLKWNIIFTYIIYTFGIIYLGGNRLQYFIREVEYSQFNINTFFGLMIGTILIVFGLDMIIYFLSLIL